MTRRRAEREELLLETATRLFEEKGYHNTSMQDLAAALCLQKCSLYYYISASFSSALQSFRPSRSTWATLPTFRQPRLTQ